jgi:hypothetical protein
VGESSDTFFLFGRINRLKVVLVPPSDLHCKLFIYTVLDAQGVETIRIPRLIPLGL